jgi:L-seryl-tRNA(Ser) seleniumtransferase
MGDSAIHEFLRKIPKVDELLQLPDLEEALSLYPRGLVVNVTREVLEEKRRHILMAKDIEKSRTIAEGIERESVAKEVKAMLNDLLSPSLRRVINATGIIVHTNLGRSVLGERAINALLEAASSYSNLEFDLDAGHRGERYVHVERLLRLLSGAEAAIVVNNNAAAVFLCLNTFAGGHEVIVSRSELVEIGGSFRIPEVMRMSGAILREVGTSNKTHPTDYENAICPNTRAVLKVHQSNYRIVGFTQEVDLKELAPLCRRHNLVLIQDLGSGNLVDMVPHGISHEPTVSEVVKAGPDLVTFSGDKLLGGPQAGIILGREKHIEQLKQNHLLRALRVDKFTVAALEATLIEYFTAGGKTPKVPTLKMMFASKDELKRRARKLKRKLAPLAGELEVNLRSVASQAGGGSLPLQDFPSVAVTIKPRRISINALEGRLRRAKPPVIARIADDELIFDLRTVLDRDFADIVKVLTEILSRNRNDL